MVNTADLTFAVSIESAIIYAQVMKSNVRGGKDQGEHQYQPDEAVFLRVSVECFAQHTAMIS